MRVQMFVGLRTLKVAVVSSLLIVKVLALKIYMSVSIGVCWCACQFQNELRFLSLRVQLGSQVVACKKIMKLCMSSVDKIFVVTLGNNVELFEVKAYLFSFFSRRDSSGPELYSFP